MRLLIYIEPTSYLMPLWREINARSAGMARIVFLEENLTQNWGIDPQNAADTEVLRGIGFTKFKRLWQLIWRRDLELVHLAGWGHPLLMAALVMAWLRRVPVSMETDTPLPVGLPRWKRMVKRLFYPVLFSLPQVFFPGGKRQAAYLRHYGVTEHRIVPANMTVDVAAISRHADGIDAARRAKIRQDLGLADGAMVFLYVGRMEPYKGLQELLNAFARLPAAAASAALLLVGDGSLRDVLAETTTADPRIRWTGRLSGTALLDAYAAADVFVLASRFEPWGLVVNEAMAAGLPVIATERVGCVDDLIQNGRNGFIVPARDAEALAKAMIRFANRPDLLLCMGEESRRFISGWTIESEAQIMLSTWDGI